MVASETRVVAQMLSLIGWGRHQVATPAWREPNLQSHLPALDALRGLAILVVTGYRFGGGGSGYAVGDWHPPGIALGMRGVDLFFVLSGFLITGILCDARGTRHYFLNFFARRTLRIFPLYYGLLLVVALWPGATTEQAAWPWLAVYGANVLQAIRGEWCLGALNHCWSLAVEEHFYLIWPAVIYALSNRRAMGLCLLLMLASAAGRVAWVRCGGNQVAPEVFTLFRLDGLALGSLIALAAREYGGLVRFVPWAKALLIGLAPLLLATGIGKMRLLYLPDLAWALACGSLLILLVTAAPGTLLAKCGESKFLRWWGKYSYGIYIFQCVLIPIASSVITARGCIDFMGSAPLGQALYLVLMTSLTCGVAVVSWHCYEKQFLKWKYLFATPDENRRAAATALGSMGMAMRNSLGQLVSLSLKSPVA